MSIKASISHGNSICKTCQKLICILSNYCFTNLLIFPRNRNLICPVVRMLVMWDCLPLQVMLDLCSNLP